MKSKLLTATLLFLSVISFAQNQNTNHLIFKGVPIDGTLSQYLVKMKQAGFIHNETLNGTARLNGDFAGYKECNISVSTLKDKDLVHKITVVFPSQKTWATLSTDYFSLKEMLTEKYGQPSDVIEKFDRDSYLDDGSRISEIQFDRCKYKSTWKTDKGNIELSIDHRGFSSCFVRLNYLDKINGEAIRAKAKDDL